MGEKEGRQLDVLNIEGCVKEGRTIVRVQEQRQEGKEGK
jgi:hypothetical protein